MTFIFIWFLLAIGIGVWASNKGRSGFGFFLLSLLLSPLVGFVFVLAVKDLSVKPDHQPNDKTHSKCPQCAEFVLPEAKICKHCGTQLDPKEAMRQRAVAASKEQESEREMRNNTLIGWSIIGGIIFLIWAFSKI